MIPLTVFLIVAPLGVLAGVAFVLWRFQERIVFQPPPWQSIPMESTSPARQVHFRAADGVELFAWVVGDCATARTAVLAFHGNAELARWLIPWAASTARATNACVVLTEYRGYDGIAGQPSYLRSVSDARTALAFVRNELQVDDSKLVYFGHSLGSAVAAELASEAPPRALVLQSPFSSARELSRRFVATLIPGVWQTISRVHFDTVARVSALNAPVWVAHGDHDVVVPVRMGRAVFAAAKRQGELLIVRGGGHNDLAEAGNDAYVEWLHRAIGDRSAKTSSAARAETRSEP